MMGFQRLSEVPAEEMIAPQPGAFSELRTTRIADRFGRNVRQAGIYLLLLPKLPRYPPCVCWKRRGIKPQRLVSNSREVNGSPRPGSGSDIAVQEPCVMPLNRDLEPVVQRRVIPNGDARPVGVPAVRCLAF